MNGASTGLPDVSDNARALNNTAATVAAFRQPLNTSPPSAPDELTAAASTAREIALNWIDTSPNETGFSLERSDDGLDFVEIASLPTNSESFNDGELLPDTLYFYRVRAWNSAGSSPYSGVATAATLPDSPPEAPGGLVASAIDTGRIRLDWIDNSDNETGFTLQRRREGTSGWINAAELESDTSSYIDVNLESGTRYTYRIRAFNGAGVSNYSATDWARTRDIPPEKLLRQQDLLGFD